MAETTMKSYLEGLVGKKFEIAASRRGDIVLGVDDIRYTVLGINVHDESVSLKIRYDNRTTDEIWLGKHLEDTEVSPKILPEHLQKRMKAHGEFMTALISRSTSALSSEPLYLHGQGWWPLPPEEEPAAKTV